MPKTAEISSYTKKGRHTTTKRQIYFLSNGGIVIDNFGIREVDVTNINQGLDNFFDQILEITQYCKFANCTHTKEPGCQIIKAIKTGVIDQKKYANYIALKKEAEFYEMNNLDKKSKNSQFGKFKKNIIKDSKKYSKKY